MRPGPLIERAFQTMGTEIRVLVGPSVEEAGQSPELAAVETQAQLVDFDRRLSRFGPTASCRCSTPIPARRSRPRPCCARR